MKMNKIFFLRPIFICLGLILLATSINAYSQPASKLLATGVRLQSVFVQVLSTDEATGISEVRFSGKNCEYCDEVYLIDETTQLTTRDYQGAMDLKLLTENTFVRASAYVIRADKWVDEVTYVETEQ